MPQFAYDDDVLRRILLRTRSVVAVGVSTNRVRPSYFVARYLHHRDIAVWPVNPAYPGQTLFGRPVLGALGDLPADADPIDMVDIFRRSDQAGEVVDAALDHLLDRGLKTIWMQIGVVDTAAADRARAAGVDVIMDRCPKIEYQRLFGELRKAGFNTGIVSSRLPPAGPKA